MFYYVLFDYNHLCSFLMVETLVCGSGGWHGLFGGEAGSEVCQGIRFEKWSYGEFLSYLYSHIKVNAAVFIASGFLSPQN
jgi:hypothetical protein